MALPFCFLVLHLSLAHAVSLSRRYDQGPVSLSGNASIFWTLNNDTRRISLALVVNDTAVLSSSGPAWLALGVSEESSGSMLGSDIASAEFGRDMLNNCTLRDRYVPFAAYPIGESTQNASSVFPKEDDCQIDGSWTLVACTRELESGTATLELERSLDAHDEQDRPIRSGSQAMIYAYGGEDFKYHEKRRRSSRVVFFNADGTYPTQEEFPLPEDVTFTHTIQATNYSVPFVNVTTYACTSNVVPVPKGGRRFLVAADPVIKSVTGKNKAHHLLVYGCKENAYSRRFLETRDCLGQGPIGNGECTVLVHGWAVGAGRYVMPEEVGMEIDESNNFLIMESHYDNPERDTDAVDVSGVKLYFADTRPIQAGSLAIGDPGVTLFGRTVKNDFEYMSTCPSNCTAIWKEEINVFASFLHMHTTGRKMYTNRFDKDGNFLETINSIEYWSNDHQYMRDFKTPKKISPGDILSTTCVYDTRKKPFTKFGLETKDEMCIDFLTYYPRQKRFSSDGSMFWCARVQLPGNGSGTICGAPSERSFSMQSNPLLNDTVGTSDKFGNAPDTCVAARKSSKSTPAPDGVRANSTERNNASRAACFPAASVVRTRKGRMSMSDLRVGDEVHVGGGKYSAVFMFTHRVSKGRYEFVELHTAKRRITLTGSHYLYVDDALVAAGKVRVGDALRGEDGGKERVVEVRQVVRGGLYNPQTVHGDVVVDGIVASAYTEAVRPRTAHAMLAPFRAAAGAFGWRVGAFERDEYVAVRGFNMVRSLVCG